MNQVLANALVSAASYLLVGLGFSLIYVCARFFHFAHGAVVTAGAYASFVFSVWAGLPFWIAVPGGVLTATVLAMGMEFTIYRPLRRRAATPATLLLASLGIYVVMQAIVTLVFGAGTQTFRAGRVPEGIPLLGIRLTLPQMVAVFGGCSLFHPDVVIPPRHRHGQEDSSRC